MRRNPFPRPALLLKKCDSSKIDSKVLAPSLPVVPNAHLGGGFRHSRVGGHSPTRRDARPATAGAMEGRGSRRGVRAKGFPPAEGREPPPPPARHAEFLSKSYVPSTSSPRTHADVRERERERERDAGASTSTSWAGQLWKQYDPINRLIFPGVGVPATYDDRGAPPHPARADPDPSAPALRSGSDEGRRANAPRDTTSSSPSRPSHIPLPSLLNATIRPQANPSSASSRCATWCTRPSW